ncbi:TSUP family transporter [Methylobrevis albus]|uniref:Probable membrane transporter protein n=1 Tax=Methylobrevis albus TaxID=2793297 RepID=A0A931MYV5_9HYPH|nr:TSUP family transporter [Methylobrevis albus]MBH0237116.1 TSUP family transporter [Methylobrevis albus]
MGILIGFGLVATVFLTSALSGVFGMAGGLVLLWVLLLALPATAAMAVHGVIQFAANGSRAVMSRRYADWHILGFAISGLAGATLLLLVVDYTPDVRLVSIVVGLMPILVWIPAHWFTLDASRPPQAVVCGFIGGALTLTVGVAGPTVDVFFIRTQLDRRTVIATKAALQVISHGVKVAFYWRSASVLGMTEAGAIALSLPFAIAGTAAGHAILQRITDANFRRWVRWVVTVIGAIYLTRGLMLTFGG